MKQTIYTIFIVGLIFGCRSYNEDIKFEVQDYKTLTPINIETNLKVANLILDPSEFEEMYNNFNKEIEIEGEFNLYKNGAVLIENELVEVQIKGGFSTKLGLKTLGVKFDKTYNNKSRKLINPKNLPFHSLDKVKAFRFRNSGSDFEGTMLKDISYTKLAINAGLNLDVMYTEQMVVFVNDVFLGVMNLRTESNTNGMSRLYGVSKSEITLAKIGGEGTLDKKDGDFDRIDSLMVAIANGNYNYVSNEIDVDNFIDYMIFESYIGNRDWPHNNVRFFAVSEGPFRFILFDLDLVAIQTIDKSPIGFINNSIKNPITDLFNIMYSNERFKQVYDARFKNLMESGVLSSTRFNTIITEYKSNIEDMMPTHINKYNTPKTFTEWYMNIDNLKNNFLKRENYLK